MLDVVDGTLFSNVMNECVNTPFHPGGTTATVGVLQFNQTLELGKYVYAVVDLISQIALALRGQILKFQIFENIRVVPEAVQ